MISSHERFTPLQRLLHWFMAVCILAMLFIGVGMESTIKPTYLTLVSIHKPLGIAILVLALIRLAVRLRSGARVPTVDTSHHLIARDIPNADESMLVIASLTRRESTFHSCCRCSRTASCLAPTPLCVPAARWV